MEQVCLLCIVQELHRARRKHPDFGKDLVHCAAIVGEEAGELIKASIDHHYAHGPLGDIETEAIQTAATALRLMVDGAGVWLNSMKKG